MPYVQRNQAGDVVALWQERQPAATEFLPASDPAIRGFLGGDPNPPEADDFSPATDLQMVRVIEDLINLLIAKKLIVLTDLPVAVQHKLLHQRARREKLLGAVSIIGEGEEGLF